MKQISEKKNSNNFDNNNINNKNNHYNDDNNNDHHHNPHQRHKNRNVGSDSQSFVKGETWKKIHLYIPIFRMEQDLKHEHRRPYCSLNIGQTIVGLCIIGLSVWCLINVIQIMEKYYNYETIISLQNDPPSETGFPGITICAPSIFRPQELARLFPQSFGRHHYEFVHRIRNLAHDSIPEYEIQDAFINNSRQFLHAESRALRRFNASDIIAKYSVQFQHLIGDCQFHSVNIRSFQPPPPQQQLHQSQSPPNYRMGSRKCVQIKQVLETIYEGKKCFTFFSDIYDIMNDDNNNRTNSDISGGGNNGNLSIVDPTDIEVEILPNEYECNHRKQFCDQSQEFLVNSSRDKMVFDLNPTIEVLIKSIDNDVWKSYVNEPILMTGN